MAEHIIWCDECDAAHGTWCPERVGNFTPHRLEYRHEAEVLSDIRRMVANRSLSDLIEDDDIDWDALVKRR